MSSEPTFAIDIMVRRREREIAVKVAAGGRVLALFGPSGAGKTTVLDAMAGLVRPVRGRIAIGGTVLFDAAAGVDLPPERRGCGMVFQDGRLFPHMTVRDNLTYGMRHAARHILTLDEACDFLGIGALLGRMPATLSGGEAQRVAIGRALLAGPRFLALDEPLSALDRARREGILGVIERVRDELGLPIVYVSHDRGEVERLADCVVEMG